MWVDRWSNYKSGIRPVRTVFVRVGINFQLTSCPNSYTKTPIFLFITCPWTVTRSYYRGAAGALLVYDATSRESFNALTNWLNDARTLASPNIVILLVGNKRDLEEAREITLLEASNFAKENDLIFLETSAKTGDNVEEAFLKCSKTILAKIETGILDPERTGSGIQFGDAALRNIQLKQRTATRTRPSDCGCKM